MEISIPPAFWGTFKPAEFVRMARRGTLNRRQAMRLWGLLGRTDSPPVGLAVMFNKDDIDRFCAELVRVQLGEPLVSPRPKTLED